MNNKELSVLRTLEFIKYLTLKGKRVRHSSRFKYNDAQNLSLETPEGTTIEINHFRINFFGHQLKEIDPITVDYGKGNSTNKEMKPTMQLNKLNSLRHRFIFTSEEFDKFTVKSKSDQINMVIENEFSMYIDKSVIIIIEGISNKNSFETFMNRQLGDSTTSGTWKYYFDKAVVEAKNGDFSNLNKYHRDIYKEEITSEDRISLLKKLIEQYWGDWDLDGITESSLFANLVITCPEPHKLNLYNTFFADSAELYVDAMNKLNSYKNEKFQVLIWLIQSFYSTRTKAELKTILSQTENLPEKNILPIFNMWYKVQLIDKFNYGAFIFKKNQPNGIKLTGMQIGILELHNGGIGRASNVKRVDYKLSSGNKLKDTVFGFDEIVGAFPLKNLPELGIIAGKIFPIPAFAAFELHLMYSDKNKNFDTLINLASLYFPYLRILQGGKVFSNLLSMGFAISGMVLDDNMVKKILSSNDDKAKAFFYCYKTLSTFYGLKGLRDTYKKYGLLMVKDIEVLIELWDVANNSHFFLSLKNSSDPYYIEISATMSKLSKELNEFKKQ